MTAVVDTAADFAADSAVAPAAEEVESFGDVHVERLLNAFVTSYHQLLNAGYGHEQALKWSSGILVALDPRRVEDFGELPPDPTPPDSDVDDEETSDDETSDYDSDEESDEESSDDETSDYDSDEESSDAEEGEVETSEDEDVSPSPPPVLEPPAPIESLAPQMVACYRCGLATFEDMCPRCGATRQTPEDPRRCPRCWEWTGGRQCCRCGYNPEAEA